MADLKKVIEDSFTQYAGAVLQSRALVDVRDCLKPSARQIFYSMKLHKFTHDKPFQKTPNPIGAALADFYIHGDTSAEAIMMRASQKFAMRYLHQPRKTPILLRLYDAVIAALPLKRTGLIGN